MVHGSEMLTAPDNPGALAELPSGGGHQDSIFLKVKESVI